MSTTKKTAANTSKTPEKKPEAIAVKIYLAKSKAAKKAGILANASVTLFGAFAVRLVVRKGKKGTWVSMPAQKGADGEYHDIFFPVTAKAREKLTNAVIEAYEEAIEDDGDELDEDDGDELDEDEDDLSF